jgi:hypothetical protein
MKKLISLTLTSHLQPVAPPHHQPPPDRHDEEAEGGCCYGCISLGKVVSEKLEKGFQRDGTKPVPRWSVRSEHATPQALPLAVPEVEGGEGAGEQRRRLTPRLFVLPLAFPQQPLLHLALAAAVAVACGVATLPQR